MVDASAGPFLFDTSAESWLARSENPEIQDWMREYRSRHSVQISAVTVLERIRGYGLLWKRAVGERRDRIEAASSLW